MAFNKAAADGAKIATVEPIRKKKYIWDIVDWFYSKGWDKYAVLFLTGVYTGLRISDIISLKVKDVFNQPSVQIREQKTMKIKEFPINKDIGYILNNFCMGMDPDEFLFQGRGGRQLDRSQVYRRINEACQALQIPGNIGTHTMRKTFGYHFYQQTKDVALLQTIFNHTAPDVTLRYIGITQDQINRAYRNYSLKLDGKDDLRTLAKRLCPSRERSHRVFAFCTAYIKNGGIKHFEFAKMVLELLLAPVKPKTKVEEDFDDEDDIDQDLYEEYYDYDY